MSVLEKFTDLPEKFAVLENSILLATFNLHSVTKFQVARPIFYLVSIHIGL